MLRRLREPLFFIGQGFQNAVVPAAIRLHFQQNPQIYTPYTPYQAEISQGRLELQYYYQEMVKDITQMDIAVASLIDNGQAGMDVVNLMKNTNPKRPNIIVEHDINPALANCLNTRAKHLKMNLHPSLNIMQTLETSPPNSIAGIICQTPTSIGNVNDYTDVCDYARNNKIITACHTDLMSSLFLTPPGESNFDIAFGNGGNFGVGMNYGGPQPAFMSLRSTLSRKAPGRIIGKSIDKHGNDAFRLTWQTREQHIRREKATSNICTSQSLLANQSVAWAMYHGEKGLNRIALEMFEKTRAFGDHVSVPILNTNFFNTITVESPGLLPKLTEHNVYPYARAPNSDQLSFTFDETHSWDDIQFLLDLINDHTNKPIGISTALNCFNGDHPSERFPHPRSSSSSPHPTSPRSQIFSSDVFSKHTNEQDLLRYLHKLGMRDYSLQNGIIPLGSCTMKYTPVDSMQASQNEELNIHPWIPIEDTVYATLIDSLSSHLKKLTGFDTVSYQSQSGAMGEYAGLTAVKSYFESKNLEPNIVLLPRSSHGTNAISIKLAGLTPVYINETDEGMIDMDSLSSLLEKHENNIACFMLTYPSTYGLYEKNIREITKAVRKAGGICYLDGANMNALIGYQIPADLGFDLCHLNLHKTFCIPHGGGGPGMGPICVRSFLAPFLPAFSDTESAISISTSPYGSGSILSISCHYLENYLTDPAKHHERIMHNTQQSIEFLSQLYTVVNPHTEHRAHEFIIDLSEFSDVGVDYLDLAKRLMDYGFHAPTMSWPLTNSFMIELTETESQEEIDRFHQAMAQIRHEITAIRTGQYTIGNNPLSNAPHTQYDLLNWNYPYSIEVGCFPVPGQHTVKFWPVCNRVDDAYGDKNFPERQVAVSACSTAK